ncbi:MAG: AAA family ATPase, partial [Cobetia marina]
DYAYKIKKPLDFGSFLDFSTLERRKHLCEQEVRLNRRLAPTLYLDTVPISGTPEAPRINDESAVFEYAVKMRQFSNRHLFSALHASGELSLELLDDLVDQLVAFHEQAERIQGDSDLGSPQMVSRTIDNEFTLIRPRLEEEAALKRLALLQEWTEETFQRLQPEFERRWQEGFVRETHGDIHLGNAVRHEGRALLFDGIEFNEELRWNDVGCDLAFLVMDLEARDEPAFAHHALNRYLELSGDYSLVRLLPYYKIYRALIRAKVAMIRYHQPELSDADRLDVMAEYERYIELAERYSEIRFPYMIIGVGVSGSGKSRFTEEMVRELGGVRIRSDVERKRLYGFAADADTGSGLNGGIYTPQATHATYERLSNLSATLLESGIPVCIDATCLKKSQRDRLRHEAEARGLPVLMISFEADEETLRRRIVKRSQRSGEASEAGLEVLDKQLANREPFAPEEHGQLIHIDTTAPNANVTLARLIREQLRLH